MEARKYIISTETTCDMEMSYYKEHSIHLLGMTYTLNGIDYDSASEENLPIKEFYRQLREGGESKTAQVSLDKATSAFEKLVEEGYDKENIERICTPIGLKIGAVTPEEIAPIFGP